MPLYEYECTKCGLRHERIEKFSGPHLKRCPDCGSKVERMITAPAIQFKGSGWYVTDYSRRSGSKDSKEATESKEAKDSKEAKEGKEAKESKEIPAVKESKKRHKEK